MTIAEIKAKLNRTSIDFSRNMAPDPADATKQVATEWLKSWDNEHRIAILAHQDVIAAAIAGATNLIIKTAVVKARKPGETKENASGEPFTQHTICTARSIEVSL